MRKTIAILLCLMLCALPLLSLAEETAAAPLILTGKVQSKETLTVYAPFGATVNDFTLREGDRLAKNATMMELETVKVYAPATGVVRGVFGQPGDSAAFVQNRYGALCYIEPAEEFLVQATVQGYTNEDNRVIHIGEKVYLQSSNNKDREGTGRVIAVNGDTYTVEVTGGTLELKDSVYLYRKSSYETDSRIGRGAVVRNEPLAVSAADGSILAVHVREGGKVERGDLLFEMVSGTLDNMEAQSAVISAPQDSVVATVDVKPGQAVNKNQSLATVYRMDQLQLVSSVSEIDAKRLHTGDSVYIEFDSIDGKTYDGKIASISGVGSVSDNYTEYTVYINFTPDESIRLGMSGTAYIID